MAKPKFIFLVDKYTLFDSLTCNTRGYFAGVLMAGLNDSNFD